MKQLFFEKYHGNGNDFIFLESQCLSFFSQVESLRDFVRKLCRRGFFIGADGIVFVEKSTQKILIVNSDGSFAATCGNALRCLGLQFLREGLWNGCEPCQIGRLVPSFFVAESIQKQEQFVLCEEIFATLLSGDLLSSQITVAMGMERTGKSLGEIQTPVGPMNGVFVELSNPHVVFVSSLFEQFTEQEFSQFGLWAQVEFPKISPIPLPVANVGMISQLPLAERWSLTVYERGAGLTLCCGSGAVAARVALEMMKMVPEGCQSVGFNLPGGPVDILHAKASKLEQRLLYGPACFAYKGNLEWC